MSNLSPTIGIAVLAAGKGTRMNAPSPKVLLPLAGQGLVDYPIQAASGLCQVLEEKGQIDGGRVAVVVGHQGDRVQDYLRQRFPSVVTCRQKEQLGLGDALGTYFQEIVWAKEVDYTLVLCGDSGLVECNHLQKLWEVVINDGLDGIVASFTPENPTGLGRIVRDGPNFRIVEERHASDFERQIGEVCSGIFLLKTELLATILKSGREQSTGGEETYLADVFAKQAKVRVEHFADKYSMLGVNDLVQLEMAESILFARKRLALMNCGVRFIDAKSCYVEHNVEVGEGTVIYPNCYIRGGSKVASACSIGAGSILIDAEIGPRVNILPYVHLEGCCIASDSVVGPFARLRRGTQLGQHSKVGNFVEIKQSTIGQHSSVSHLSYIGDAQIGANSNIGCGFITCNYDGEQKHRTTIGDNAFIGSDTPGDRSYRYW